MLKFMRILVPTLFIAVACGHGDQEIVVSAARRAETQPHGDSEDSIPSEERSAICPDEFRVHLTSADILAKVMTMARNAAVGAVVDVTPITFSDDLQGRSGERSVALALTIEESIAGDLHVGESATLLVAPWERNRYEAGDRVLFLGEPFDDVARKRTGGESAGAVGDFLVNERLHPFSIRYLITKDDTVLNPYPADCEEAITNLWMSGTPLDAVRRDVEVAVLSEPESQGG